MRRIRDPAAILSAVLHILAAGALTATSATAPDPQLPGTAWPSYRLPHRVLALNRSASRPGTPLRTLLAS